MADINVKIINNNDDFAYVFGDGIYLNGGVLTNCISYYKFNEGGYIFDSVGAAINYGNNTNNYKNHIMYTVKGQTVARISQVHYYQANKNIVILQVNVGTKKGYVYFCNIKVTNLKKKKHYEFSKREGNIAVSYNEDTYKISRHISIQCNSICYRLAGTVNVDTSRLCSSEANTSNASSSDSAKENEAINNIASNASNSSNNNSGGDIQVPYANAIKTFVAAKVYNFNEHKNVYRDYEIDEDGNYVQVGDAKGPGVEFGKYMDYLNKTGVVNYKKLKNIIGAPYQFLSTTDCRLSTLMGGKTSYESELESAGYEFSEKILSRMPLLFITPCNSTFMGNTTAKSRELLLSQVDSSTIPDEEKQNALEALLEDYTGKLYSVIPAYKEYFDYVNPLCRAGAIFLGIQDKVIDGVPLDAFHWGWNEGPEYEFYQEEEDADGDSEEENEETDVEGEEANDSGGESTGDTNENEETEVEPEEKKEKEKYDYTNDVNSFNHQDESVHDHLKSWITYSNAIPFYINSEATFQETFSNETTDSILASTINGLSDKAREIQFLIGTAKNAVGEAFDKVDKTLSNVREQINNIVSKVSGGNSIFTTIANSVKTIVSGGRMIFPQIWSNSTHSKSYNISIKLVTPSNDRLSWWLNIYVPLCHLLALVLPRSEYVNSYTTPFLIKAFYKGMFNIDMGIITEMSFNRGKEGSWTKDALPTVVDVSFTIQDLYTGMGMTSTGSMYKGKTLQNIAEMDYVANLCGVNINEPDIFRMVDLWAVFNIKDRIYDFIPNTFLNAFDSVRNGAMKLFEGFFY